MLSSNSKLIKQKSLLRELPYLLSTWNSDRSYLKVKSSVNDTFGEDGTVKTLKGENPEKDVVVDWKSTYNSWKTNRWLIIDRRLRSAVAASHLIASPPEATMSRRMIRKTECRGACGPEPLMGEMCRPTQRSRGRSRWRQPTHVSQR